jgi:hypothetical protein
MVNRKSQNKVSDLETPVDLKTSTEESLESLPLDDLINQCAEPLAVELLESQLTGAIHEHIYRLLTSQDPADIAQMQALFRRIGFIAAGTALSESFGAFSQNALPAAPSNEAINVS